MAKFSLHYPMKEYEKPYSLLYERMTEKNYCMELFAEDNASKYLIILGHFMKKRNHFVNTDFILIMIFFCNDLCWDQCCG